MSIGSITIAAWETLIKNNVTSMPIRPAQIAQEMGISVFEYSEFSRATGRNLNDIQEKYGADGFTQMIDDEHVIFYNQEHCPGRVRWTLAHELGHIILGHTFGVTGALTRQGKKKDFYDIQADNFAARLLCPESVVHLCGVESQYELQELTDLSNIASKYAWQDLCERRMRGDFILAGIEKILVQQFQQCIAEYIADKADESPLVDIPIPMWRRI